MVGAEQVPGINLGLDLLEPRVDRVREERSGRSSTLVSRWRLRG